MVQRKAIHPVKLNLVRYEEEKDTRVCSVEKEGREIGWKVLLESSRRVEKLCGKETRETIKGGGGKKIRDMRYKW